MTPQHPYNRALSDKWVAILVLDYHNLPQIYCTGAALIQACLLHSRNSYVYELIQHGRIAE